MRVSLDVFGREVIAVEVAGYEEDGDLNGGTYDDEPEFRDVGSDTTPVDLDSWREQREDADLPPTVLVAGHSRRGRQRPPNIRLGGRSPRSQSTSVRASVDVNRCKTTGFGFRSNV
ncbi:hypothetical protein [Gordonia humi]|uniref:Uncharacterized protein n=1 Tax=Gordonia humi TaxID=686429 RepID=A0A840EWV5_9ACTN|nr:hypothetical protein [Gordonia humi]MBB4136071.1 hypothetical protein [Gordonia humi]